MVTTYERGKIEGQIETCRENVLMLLEARFPPLPEGMEKRVSALSLDQLKKLLVDIVKANAIDDLTVLK